MDSCFQTSSEEETQISNLAACHHSGFSQDIVHAFQQSYTIRNHDCKYHKLAKLCELVQVLTRSACVRAECVFNCVIFRSRAIQRAEQCLRALH